MMMLNIKKTIKSKCKTLMDTSTYWKINFNIIANRSVPRLFKTVLIYGAVTSCPLLPYSIVKEHNNLNSRNEYRNLGIVEIITKCEM